MKLFNELINQNHFNDGEIVGFDNNQKEIILELMKIVRKHTIKECIQIHNNELLKLDELFRNSYL